MKQIIKKVCKNEECEKVFEAKKTAQQFCSVECARAYAKKHQIGFFGLH